ncbi:acyl CoA:acetate/3-ketoacid CoA transferase [Gelria sp. Kuro-4]|uniref:acyl CoA:acetate/3-ketoacid CoA transferase n=1 Tax=Gelria sp. Kuro-4 TaxID=2796927 RepID=UPI001BEEF357|nr:CoA-transferase [Gelria sp. Kuro-4]BCV24596.1 propionate CoA-transferase [Gelria sp. Kuro-4]
MKSKVMTATEAANLIKDHDVITVTGNCEMLMPDAVLAALENRFQTTGSPAGLGLYYPVISGAQREGTGVDRLAHPGMLKRVIASSMYTLKVKRICDLIAENQVEAYLMPMGAMWQLLRAIAGKMPGTLTPVGVGSFIDPRTGIGKLTPQTVEDLVSVVTIEGKEYLFYKAFPINVAIIRGTTADEVGNVSIEDEPISSGILSIAMAAKNSGGKVIAQVKRLAAKGSIHPRRVAVPGMFVDAIVVDPHQQDFFPYNPYLTGDLRQPKDQSSRLPLTWQKPLLRRAALELRPEQVVNFGFGVAAGVAQVAAEEGIEDDVWFTVEHGPIGGVPNTKDAFGASVNPLALMDSPMIFDMYDGGGLDITFLGMAQVDKQGNVNVSKVNGKYNLGGFLDIVYRTPRIVFCGSFTAGGFDAEVKDGRLFIKQEGRIAKFVEHVDQETFSGPQAVANGQQALYVTERAVFELVPEGIKLLEIAPGVDLEKDILARMAFRPIISENLRTMDPALFLEAKLGLRDRFTGGASQS